MRLWVTDDSFLTSVPALQNALSPFLSLSVQFLFLPLFVVKENIFLKFGLSQKHTFGDIKWVLPFQKIEKSICLCKIIIFPFHSSTIGSQKVRFPILLPPNNFT